MSTATAGTPRQARTRDDELARLIAFQRVDDESPRVWTGPCGHVLLNMANEASLEDRPGEAGGLAPTLADLAVDQQPGPLEQLELLETELRIARNLSPAAARRWCGKIPRSSIVGVVGLASVWDARHTRYDPASGPCPVCRDSTGFRSRGVCVVCSRSADDFHQLPMQPPPLAAKIKRRLRGGLRGKN